MRLRVFNTYWPVAPLAEDLLPWLGTRGWDVEFVVGGAPYRFEVEADGPFRVREVGSFGVRPTSTWAKGFLGLNYLVRALVRGSTGPGVDCNLVLTQPPLSGLLGLLLKRLRGQPYCYVLQDLYPDMAIELGRMKRGGVAARVLAALQRRALRAADRVVVIGRCMRDRVVEKGVPAERVSVIPNWPGRETRRPEGTGAELRREMGWEGRTVVMYAGNVGIPQHFQDLLTVAERLRDEPRIAFAVVGDGARKASLLAEVADRELRNVVFLPFLNDRYPVGEILRAGDLHLVPLRAEVTGLAVPSKFYSIVAAGRVPVFQGDPGCEVARVVEETGAGFSVEEGDVEGLMSSVLTMDLAGPEREAVEAKVRELAATLASADAPLERYRAIIRSAAGEGA